MAKLETGGRMADPDEFYEALIAAHADLSEARSQALNTRLVLLLANHIGDRAVFELALAEARADPES